MEGYDRADVLLDGKWTTADNAHAGVDWANGPDSAAVALLKRNGGGRYDVEWSMDLSPRESRRLTGRREHLCWKCRDGRTRAHHRRCSKRGGKIERLRSAWRAETQASRMDRPSPGRLRGSMLEQARVYGHWWRRYDEQVEDIRREMSPLTASPERLKELAALCEVA